MDPKTRSLSHVKQFFATAIRPALLVLAGLAPWVSGPFCHAEDPPPAAIPHIERESVNRVQIDVSVIDPKGSDWASVKGLPREVFKLRLDGKLLEGETADKVEFDEICGSLPAHREGFLASEQPTLIVLIDLNFLAPNMRHAVVRALDELAQRSEQVSLRVKILVYSRKLLPLTEGFTSQPDAIREAARTLENLVSVGPSRIAKSPFSGGLEQGSKAVFTSPDALSGATSDDTSDFVRGVPAIKIESSAINIFSNRAEMGEALPSAPGMSLGRLDVDPRPSIAALESVMIAHGSIPGRKALVLFTSGWFDLSEELWLTQVTETLHAAQKGFTIWPVDARGLSGDRSLARNSRLMSYLASNSGGEAIHSAGRLAVSFERALSQLSCYYLFSVPVDPPRKGFKRHTVLVDLDTKTHPEFWRYRVRAPSGFTLLGENTTRQQRRLAALIEPNSHNFPEVRITAAYPALNGEKLVTPVEISVLLTDLLFQPGGEGHSYLARISWEGVVTDQKKREVCRLGDGIARIIRAPRPPTRHPPAMLVLESRCQLPGPGNYEIRVIVEDLLTGDVGASSALVGIPSPSDRIAQLSALRLGRNSGRDFLFRDEGKPQLEIPRDASRRGFIPIKSGELLARSDQLALRFVSCGQDGPPRVVLFQQTATKANPGTAEAPSPLEKKAMYQVLTSSRSAIRHAQWSCQEYEAVVPANTLPPGRYTLALFERSLKAESRADLNRLMSEGITAARVEFEVGDPPSTIPAPKGSDT